MSVIITWWLAVSKIDILDNFSFTWSRFSSMVLKNKPYKCWSCAELWEVFSFLMKNIYLFHNLFDLLVVVLAFWISILKIFKLLHNCWHRVKDITSFEFFGKFFRLYCKLLSKFCDISFQEYVSKGFAQPVFNGDLVYKLRRVKGTANFISSETKIFKRLRRRQYDPLIIERAIGSGDRLLVHTWDVHGWFAVLLRTSCYEFVIMYFIVSTCWIWSMHVVEWTCAM